MKEKVIDFSSKYNVRVFNARDEIDSNQIKRIMPNFGGNLSYEFVRQQTIHGSCFGLALLPTKQGSSEEEAEKLIGFVVFEPPIKEKEINAQFHIAIFTNKKGQNDNQTKFAGDLLDYLREHLDIKDFKAEFYLNQRGD